MLIDDLRLGGTDVEVASSAEADDHLVTGLARFVDPSGLAVELFYGPILDHVPVQTPLISRFVTGDMRTRLRQVQVPTDLRNVAQRGQRIVIVEVSTKAFLIAITRDAYHQRIAILCTGEERQARRFTT